MTHLCFPSAVTFQRKSSDVEYTHEQVFLFLKVKSSFRKFSFACGEISLASQNHLILLINIKQHREVKCGEMVRWNGFMLTDLLQSYKWLYYVTHASHKNNWLSPIICHVDPCIVSGECNSHQTRFSRHCTKTAWNFLERFRDFPSYIGLLATLQNLKRIFLISVMSPKFFWEMKGTPDGEKLVSSVTLVRRAEGGKVRRVYSNISCANKPMTQLLTSLDGICKPGVEIRPNRK